MCNLVDVVRDDSSNKGQAVKTKIIPSNAVARRIIPA